MKAVTLIRGGEEFLVSEALAQLRDRAVRRGYEIEERSAREALELTYALGTSSLFGGGRLVVVPDADDLSADALAHVAAWAAAAPEDVALVLVGGSAKLAKALGGVADVIELKSVRFREADWLVQRARKIGRTLTGEGAAALIEAVGSDLRDLASALEQLATAGREPIDAPAVREHFRGLEPEVWSFVDAVLDGDRRAAHAWLRALLERGENAIGILTALANQVRLVAMVREVERKPPAALARELGVKEGKLRRALRQARATDDERLRRAFGLLAQADLALKGGDRGEDEPNEIVLELLVAELLAEPEAGRAAR